MIKIIPQYFLLKITRLINGNIMIKVLLVLLLGITFSAQAEVKKVERKDIELATLIALMVASYDDFGWTDYTCVQLMNESLMAPKKVINDKKMKKDDHKLFKLAAQLFIAEVTKDGFVWSESSCKELVPESIEAARNVITKKKVDDKLFKLAAQLFIAEVAKDGFVWSESSCKELVPESIEAARNVITKEKMGNGIQRLILKMELTEKGKVIALASQLLLEAASEDGFAWTDYTCVQLMSEAFEAAIEAINKRKKMKVDEPSKMRKDLIL